MRVKLTKTQVSDILDMITYLLTEFPYGTRSEKILDLLVNEIRIKLRNKLDARGVTQFSITLTEIQALAFEEWMSEMASSIPEKAFVNEQNLTKQITNEINRLYG